MLFLLLNTQCPDIYTLLRLVALMTIIELTDYTTEPIGTGHGLYDVSFILSKGDVCSIQTDSQDDAHNFLRALATLTPPVNGSYAFKGDKLDFSDYRNLLCYKKQIGYVGPDSALLSNRTIRENLLFMRYHFENSLSIDLDDNTAHLCRLFEIESELDMRPAAMNPLDVRVAITIRELAKSPEVLLLFRPEDFVGQTKFDLLMDILKKLVASETPVVFLSYENGFLETLSSRKIVIADGRLKTVGSQ